MNKLMATFVILFISSTVFASHPHQAVCLASGSYKTGEAVSFLLQMSSERTYQQGDPNKDVYNYSFSARICDDDNDSGQCSTYKSSAPLTDLKQTVTLRGMKNSGKVLFQGVLAGDSLKGELIKMELNGAKVVRTMVPFEAKLNCISQTWVPLKAEDDSNSY